MSTEHFENLEQLAQRAVACKHWRWMPGMLVVYPRAASAHLEANVPPFKGYKVTVCFRHTERDEEPYLGCQPDLIDPATLGCLLALVREAHCDQRMFVETYSFLRNNWRCTGVSFSMQWDAPTEAGALVAALEAAP